MANFRERLFKGKVVFEEPSNSCRQREGTKDHRGSFLLKWDDIRALASLLEVEGQQSVKSSFGIDGHQYMATP